MVQLEISKAKPLFEDVLQACRERLSDRHPGTLNSISNMGFLLKDMGQLEEAKPLYEEALQAYCRRRGRRWATSTRARWPRSTT